MYITIFNTKFNQDEIFSLNKSAVADYSVFTTTIYGGNRSRHSSGIFLPKFYLSQGVGIFPTPSKAEFVARATLRNKPSNRTNKGGYQPLVVVVEPLPRLLNVGKFLQNKLTEIIKMPTTQSVKTHQKQPPLQSQHLADFPQNLTRCNRCDVATFPTFGGVSANAVHPTEQKTILPAVAVFGYPVGVVAKSTTSREKLNDLSVANDSTPLTRAFFVRSLRTPKETQRIAILAALRGSLSMVGRIGQRLGVGCLPQIAVSHPDTSYRPAVRSQAVALKSICGAITMLFKFLVLGEKRLTISIRAKSEQEARQKLQFTSPALCVARFNTSKRGIYA